MSRRVWRARVREGERKQKADRKRIRRVEGWRGEERAASSGQGGRPRSGAEDGGMEGRSD